MWSPIFMIQHPHFPEDRYLGALFEEQKGHFVFYVGYSGCRKTSLFPTRELSACLPSNLPNHQPPGYIGQHSFSLLPDETVTYIGGKKKGSFVKTRREPEQGSYVPVPKK